MAKTLSGLKLQWEKEQEAYKTQELGSGVHSFVKDILQSEALFNLREGHLATPLTDRDNEFIHEKKAKKKKRIDFVIYVNSEIIIPVEAEQYTHIEQGEGQLAEYQSILEKKYGILTDGYTWRFYNNNIYRVLTFDQMVSDTTYFLEFWKEYIKPESYYLSFFEETGQLSFFGIQELPVENNRHLFFDDITTLIKGFSNKLRVEGYFNGLSQKEAKRNAIEATYAYIIQFILYKTLVDNKFKDLPEDYKSRIDTIHHAVKNSSYKAILAAVDGISDKISKGIYKPFLEEQKHISTKLLELLHQAKNELNEVSPWLDILVFIKKYNFCNVRNEIFGYIYENYLKELYGEENKGQFFTDPAVVNFMLQQIGYTAKEIGAKVAEKQFDKLSIVDPACGSGSFLYGASNEIIKACNKAKLKTSKVVQGLVTTNIFGLDIEEFPLYLAEMNILMRMLPVIMGEQYNNPLDKKIKIFLTRDSIAEFIGSGISNVDEQISFSDKIIRPKYESYIRSEEDLGEMKDSMTAIPRRRFDYVIANPPYVTYNECSKRGILIFNLVKARKVKLNNIYGVNLHSVPGARKKYRPNPNLYAFFVALGLALLKPNGRLSYIIPQTLLTAGDLDVLRYHLSKYVTIERIITFNRNLFIDRGLEQKEVIHTSSLIMVISRGLPTKEHTVEIVNYEDGNDTIDETMYNISVGKKVNTKELAQTELLDNFKNWNYILHESNIAKMLQDHSKNSLDIEIYYDHKKAQHLFHQKFYFDSGYSIDERMLLSKPKDGGLHYLLPKLNSKYWTVKEFKGYWPNIREGKARMRIKLRQANQRYNLLDSHYKVLWSYMNPMRFHFTDAPVIWPRNQICAIGTNDKEEILYLFSILNSQVIYKIIKLQLRSEFEKDLLVSTSSIKQYVRVPTITSKNEYMKKEIIKVTQKMLALEDITLSDYVDLSSVLVQRFNDIEVVKNTLILVHNGDKTKLHIKSHEQLISDTLLNYWGAEKHKLEKSAISLDELRDLPIIDFQGQTKIKNYIDDLVFALYFKVSIEHASLSNADNIHQLCLDNKHYRLFQP